MKLITAVVSLFVILAVVGLFFASLAVAKYRQNLISSLAEESSMSKYVKEELQLAKDIYWMEQFMELAGSDSISLMVDLKDSTVQLGLKGRILLKSKILKHYPGDFPGNFNDDVYTHFASVSSITSEHAPIAKRPVRKMSVQNEPASKEWTDENSIRSLYWSFTTENDFRMIMTGVSAEIDSTYRLNPVTDLLKYRIYDFIKGIPFFNYNPTIYLWVDKQDVKAFYRAVPSEGNVLFRN